MMELQEYIDMINFNAVIYNPELFREDNIEKAKEYILSKDFLDRLLNEDFEKFDKKTIANIYKIVDYLNENKMLDNTTLNKLKILLNSSTGSKADEFYKEEFYIRNHAIDDRTKAFLEIVYIRNPNIKDAIIKSLAVESYNISVICNAEMNEYGSTGIELFNKLYINHGGYINEGFMYTINSMLYRYPELLKQDEVKYNILIILELYRIQSKRKLSFLHDTSKQLIKELKKDDK